MFAGAAIGALALLEPHYESAKDMDPRALVAGIVERTTRLDRILTLPDPEPQDYPRVPTGPACSRDRGP
jgi:hypothetical protein